jgi:ATP-dependent exoDNAse (exonuclease V) beta subunit
MFSAFRVPDAILREVSVNYDSNQAAAIAARSNVVVSAGAGAGKTSVLVGRYIRLVAEDHIPVDQILTLTFTRKAAAEMHERIYHALGQRGEDAFVAEQLQRFDAAVVSTLDSFCGSVARSDCASFGVAPTFVVDEKKMETFSDDLALSFLLGRKPEHSGVVQSLVRLNRFGPLWRDGFAKLARDHFLVSRELDLAGMVAAQREFLLGELVRYAGELDAAAAGIGGLDAAVAKCIASAQQIIAGVDVGALTDGSMVAMLRETNADGPVSDELRGHLAGLLSQMTSFADIKKTCGSSKSPEVAQFKSIVDDIQSCVAHLRDLLVTLGSWHEMVGATALASQFQSIVTAEKRRSGVLSYHDVTALAISVLERDVELRRYYKRRFKAIMIDEFQDNNDEQKQLLYLLAERTDRESPGVPGPTDLDPGKLFFVGDEKQSIYRFRGADVSVFKRLSEELGGARSSITLGSNYRSEPGLIEFFNAFFSRVFSDPEPDYEARFAPLGSRAATPGVKPSVQLWQLVGRDKDPELMTEDEAEAYHIARFIRQSVDDGSLMVAAHDPTPSARPAGYRDFAILMRSTGNQMRIERMLRLMGIPYVAQTARSLFLEAPMNDIYNALQLVLYPHDRVALAAFMRSPLVGMSDDGVVRVLAAEPGAFGDVSSLGPVDQERYELAVSRNARLTELADTVRLTDLVHHIWYHWGYRYHLLRRDEYTAYLEHYDYIYELARLYEDKGLAAFLSTIRSNIGRNERIDELNIVRDQSDGVNIMTIHKAKGLEFPVVIVANTGNRGRNDSVSSAPFYRSDQQGLVFNVSTGQTDTPKERAVNFIYRLEHDEAALQDVAEQRRLLYVAATRAETHLVFSGYQRGNDKSLMTMLAPPFAEAAGELGDSPAISIAIRDLEPVPIASRARQHKARVRDIGKLADNYAAAARAGKVTARHYARRVFTPTELNAIHLSEAVPGSEGTAADGAATVARDLFIDTSAGQGLADAFGTFSHYCVEQLGSGRMDARALANPGILPASVRPPLEGKKLAQFLSEGVELANGFLASELWRLVPGKAAPEFELPFLLRLPPETGSGQTAHPTRVRGKMDLVLDCDDKVIVVDFKTDRLLVPEHYAVQMELYRRAARAIYGKSAQSVLYSLRSATAFPADTEIDDKTLGRLVASLGQVPLGQG